MRHQYTLMCGLMQANVPEIFRSLMSHILKSHFNHSVWEEKKSVFLDNTNSPVYE